MTGVDSIGGLAMERVGAAIRTAALRTGVDFSYLMAQARVESGLNPQAKARTSSARGLYQFTNATWLETVRKHGAAHGLGWAADAIASGTAGAGSAARATILGLRENAEAAALMAGAFARDNGAALEHRLGRAAGATDLYMAHFLGAGGAARFLRGMAATPGAAAATLLPAAALANRGVFYAKDGSARSLAEVYARFEAKIEGPNSVSEARPHAARQPRATPSRQQPSQTTPSRGQVDAHVDKARMAYMLLAELGG